MQPEPGERPRGVGGKLKDTTQVWYNFKFTQLNLKGEFNGWEVACTKHPGKIACRKHMTVGAKGSRELVERRLKWWCLTASKYDSRDSHVHCGVFPPDIPSLADIEAQAEAGM